MNSIAGILKYHQIGKICSLTAACMLGDKSAQALLTLFWKSLYKEFQKLAPELPYILEECTRTRKQEKINMLLVCVLL